MGWFAASYAQSPLMLIPLYGIIGGLGVGIAYGCPIAVSAAWFPDKRGLAVGLTVLGFGFSSALITQINKFLLAGGAGIMDIMKMFGVAFLIITIVFSLLLAFPPSGWCPRGWKPPAPKAGAAPMANLTRSEMTKTKTFVGLWLCYTIGALAGLTAIGIAGPVGQDMLTKCRLCSGGGNRVDNYVDHPLRSGQWCGQANLRHADGQAKSEKHSIDNLCSHPCRLPVAVHKLLL